MSKRLAVWPPRDRLSARRGGIAKSWTAETSFTVGTAEIVANRDRGTAPAGFFFSIITDGWSNGRDNFDAYRDLHYRWTFDDPGYYTRHDSDDLPWGRYFNVSGTPTLVNDGTVPLDGSNNPYPFLGNDRNIAYGPHVSHTFDFTARSGSLDPWGGGETQRTCTVTCEIRMSPTDADPLLTVTKEDVEIDHPDAVFSAAQTFLIANSATPVGDEPAHSGTIYTSLAAAGVAGRSSNEPRVRYLMRRGDTFPAQTNSDKFGNSNIAKLMLGTYGASDTPPIVNLPTDINWASTAFPFRDTLEHFGSTEERELILEGWELAYPYDPSDPNGVTYQPPSGLDLRVASSFKTVWDMKFSGLMVAIGVRGKSFKEIAIANTYITNYCNYGIYINGDAERFGMAGVFIKQHPEAVRGPGTWVSTYPWSTPPFWVGHTTIRVEGHKGPIALNCVDFLNVAGNGHPHQPSLRMTGMVESQFSVGELAEFSVDRMRTEGGPSIIQVSDASSKPPNADSGPARRVLFDKVYITFQHGPDTPIKSEFTGVTVRNTVVVFPSNTTWMTGGASSIDPVNTLKRGNNNFMEFVPKTWEFEFSANNLDHETVAYNNTFVNLRASADQRSGDEVFPNATAHMDGRTYTENNIWAFPFGTPNATHDLAFDYLQGAGSNAVYVPDGSTIAGDWLDLTPLFEPGQKGYSLSDWYLDEGEETFRTVYGTDPDDAPILTPKTGSPLAGGANTDLHVAVDDFFGNIRGANPSRGAVEPT